MSSTDPVTEKTFTDLLYKFISVYLGIEFFIWGISNFTADYDFDTRFGYPEWVQIPIGVSETLAGLGLFHHRTNLVSLIVLAIVMTGAIVSHISVQDGGYGMPLKYLIYFALMLYYKRDTVANWKIHSR